MLRAGTNSVHPIYDHPLLHEFKLTDAATVRGVDLFPPPVSWAPPNCILEVDDVSQEWTWRQPFDLIHMRILDAAFTHEEQETLYQRCYK